MASLLARTVAGFAFLFAVMSVIIFAAAGTLAYWQGWALLAVYLGSSALITLWLWRHDKALLARRVRAGPVAEPDPTQKLIQGLAGFIFLAALAVPALDQRFAWSSPPLAVVLIGDALVAAGFLLVFLVFRENTFSSGVIELADDQRVIDTGPYAHVRHPMYAGALMMFVGMPLALGSWWGLLVALAIVPVLVVRLTREEAYLSAHLAGYAEYLRSVRCRLAPGIW